MMTSCRNIDLGTSVLDLIACGCGRRQFPLGNFPKSVCKVSSTRSYGGGNLVFLRRDMGSCKAVPTKPKDNVSLVNGIGETKTVTFDLRQDSKEPISLATLFEVVADDLQTLNDNLLSIVGAENPVLISAAEQIFGAGGKRMRPGLVFLVSRATAELAGLKELTTEHRRLGEIIEMIHTASLIHDDVLDESDMRRGKETVHELFGTRVAVLAGDFMFAQASWYLANLENLEVIKLISQVIKDFASGEIKQASSLFDCDVTLDDYLLKSYFKTASLVAASTKGAAIFSRVETHVTEQMYEFGKNLGLSFQVVDDILDFTQSTEQLGKPAGSDLAKGNLTAPVIFALEKQPRLREIIESEFCEEGSLEEAIEAVIEGGGIRRAQELAREKADEALKNLQCLPPSGFRSALEEMAPARWKWNPAMGMRPGTCDHYECPTFKLAEAGYGYDLRVYDSAVWMSTAPISAPSMTQATKTGFQRLFSYIQGDNKNKTKMNMTAPVMTQATPGKSVYTVSFYLPKKNQQNPPLADDLHVQPWKPTYVAVRQFGGYASDDAAKKEAAALMDSLKGTEWIVAIEKSKGKSPEYLVADYNPPFQTTARVNEILVPFNM